MKENIKYILWILGVILGVFLAGWKVQDYFDERYIRKPITSQDPAKQISPRTDVPIGTIVAYYLSGNPPRGWLLCNGDPVPDEKEYKEFRKLFKQTPDLQGMFLRGAGRNKDSRFQYKNDNNRSIGVKQGYSTALPVDKDKPFKTSTQNNGEVKIPWTPVNQAIKNYSTDMGFTVKKEGRGSTFNVTIPKLEISEGGDEETRPNNIAVNFIIKAY